MVFSKQKLNRAGFTLVEILVSMAILGIVAAGMATLMVSTNNQMRNYGSKFNSMALALEMKSELDVPELCKNLLVNQVVTAAAKNPVRLAMSNGTTIQANAALRTYGVYVDELYFDSATASGTSATSNPISTASLYLRTSGFDGAKSPSDPEYKGVRFNKILVTSLTFEHNGSGTILSCKAAMGLVENCVSMNGSYDPATQKCRLPADLLCAQAGGTWTGTACDQAAPASASIICGNLGGSWDGTCHMPMPPPQIIYQTTNTTTTVAGGGDGGSGSATGGTGSSGSSNSGTTSVEQTGSCKQSPSGESGNWSTGQRVQSGYMFYMCVGGSWLLTGDTTPPAQSGDGGGGGGDGGGG